jgi:hypothetical protein
VNAADLAFTYCLKGIDRYVESMEQLQATEQAYLRVTTRDPKIRPNYNDLCLLILDDTGDNALKNRLKKTYRAMRKRVTEQFGDRGKLLHFHDSLYFGDSTDSIGIQLADLCAYFIGVHKSRSHDDKGEEVSRKSEEFYRMFDKCIFHSEIFPEAKS